jgi:hypothetical protein
VTQLDRFFADEREVDLPRARSFVRWRNDLRVRDDGALSASTDVRVEVQLPSLNRRLRHLRLSVTSSTAGTADRRLAGESPPDALDATSAGLRLSFPQSALASLDAQAGLLFSLPVGWYSRVRLRHLRPLDASLLARDALAVFWQTNTGYGTRQDASLERPLGPWLLARLGGTGILTERSRGWEWNLDLSLLAALGPRTALSLSGGALGSTRAGLVVEKWRAGARLRRDVVRRWIYLELEPEAEWTRPPGGGRRRLRAVVLRLEVQFDASTLETPGPGPPST